MLMTRCRAMHSVRHTALGEQALHGCISSCLRTARRNTQIFIDEQFQGKGYGRTAIKLVFDDMKKDGKYDKVVLCYIEGNDVAKKLYASYGFMEIDRDENEIIMELKL